MLEYGEEEVDAYNPNELQGMWEIDLNTKRFLKSIRELDYLERRNGDLVNFDETFHGKYVLFFCFEKPQLQEFFPLVFPDDLVKTCLELYYMRDDFEMIVIAKSTNSYNDFHTFMAYFPPMSLAVPYEDPEPRESLCEFLGLDQPGYKCLLVNLEKGVMSYGVHVNEQLLHLLPERPLDFNTFINRVVKAMWPMIPELVKHPPLGERQCPLARQIKYLDPEYPDDIRMAVYKVRKSCPVQIGQSFDVISLLSSGLGSLNCLYRNGSGAGSQFVQVNEETFKGKYIMVCCYNVVPTFHADPDSLILQGLVNLCSELYSKRQDFELVVVAKMNEFLNYEVLFDRFMSGFPASCLVVPFSNSKGRDFICKYLDLGDHCSTLFLDDKGSVLFHGEPTFALNFGADAFPFTKEHRLNFSVTDEPLWKSSSTNLGQLLHCKPSDEVDRINSAGVWEAKTISELSTKLVWLYLCVSGDFIPTLDEVYQQCISKNLEIQILVVYQPLGYCLDPQLYKMKIDSVLKRQMLDWWRLPFDNSVSLRLKWNVDSFYEDKLVIVGPRGEFLDPYGKEIMRNYGIDGYPFTREGLVQRELKKLKEVTLESLLVHGSRDFVRRCYDRFPVAKLQGKNVLVYLDCLHNLERCENLMSWYREMKTTGTNFEVVFVRRVDDDDSEEVEVDDDDNEEVEVDDDDNEEVEVDDDDSEEVDGDVSIVDAMPWLVCPFNFDHSTSINTKLFTGESFDALVQFGQNGQISAFHRLDNLPSFNFGLNAFLFGDNLREHVISQFPEEFMAGMK